MFIPLDLLKKQNIAKLGGGAHFLCLIFGLWLAAAAFAPTPALAQCGTTVPGSPSFTTSATDGTATIDWTASTGFGGCTLSGYVVHLRVAGTAWPSSNANFFPAGVTATPVGGATVTISTDSMGVADLGFDEMTTSVTLSGLTVGSTYEMRINSFEDDGFTISAWAATQTLTISAVLPPTAVTAMAKDLTSDTVTLTWTNSTTTGAAHYVRWRLNAQAAADMWMSLDGADATDCAAALPTSCGADQSTNATSGLEITGLTSGADYIFEVIAVVGSDASAWVARGGGPHSDDPHLSGFDLSGFQSVVDLFSEDRTQLSYTVLAGSAVTSTTVTALPNGMLGGALAQIGSGADAPAAKTAAEATTGSDRETLAVTLSAGTVTHIAIVATAEDGTTKVTYTFTITSAAGTEDTLHELSALDGTFTPAFSAGATTAHYDVVVPQAQTRAGIELAASDPSATLAITPGRNSRLRLGDTDFTITVTPADGTSAVRTITLTISRPPPEALPSKLRVGVGKIGNNPTPHWEISTAALIATDPYRVRWRRSAGQGSTANAGAIGRWEPSADGMPVTGSTSLSASNCMNAIATAVSDCEFTEIPSASLSEITTVLDVQVRAVGLYGAGPWSDSGTFSATVPTSAAPAAPAGVAGAGGGELLVTWTASADTHTSNAVRWRVALIAATDPDGTPNNGDETAEVPAGAWQGWVDAANLDNSPIVGDSDFGVIADSPTSHRITNLTDDVVYDIQVRAQNGGAVGAWGTAVTATPGTGTADARLSALGISGLITATGNADRAILTPAFDPAITEYSLYGETLGITVAPTAANASATVAVTGGSGSGNDKHGATATGRRVFTITVTAADGTTTKTYTIVSEVPARATTFAFTDANGDALPITPNRHTGTQRTYVKDYTIHTVVTTGSIRVRSNYEANKFGGSFTNPAPRIGVNDGSFVDIDNPGTYAALENNVVTDVPLARGMNEVQLIFHAKNDSTATATLEPVINTIHVYRTNMAATDAMLRALAVEADAGANPMIDGGFVAGTTDYDIVITAGNAGATATLTFDATPVDATASVTAGATAMTHASAPGIDTHTLTVTAEDGTATQDYNFRLIRTPGLSALTLKDAEDNDIAITGTIADTTFMYTADKVAGPVSSITLTPTYASAATIREIKVNERAPITLADSAEDNTIALDVGKNTIELHFAGPAAPDTKDPVIYTIEIEREPDARTAEMTQKAEAVAKSVTSAVVLSGVLDAVSQNAFDAGGSFTPFVDVGARTEQGTRQAFAPRAAARQVAAPLLLSEQAVSKDMDWRDLLGASRFRLGITAGEFGEALGGGEWSVWGSGDVRGFNGGGEVETEGMGYSGYLGTDYKKGDWLVGIAAGYSTTTADVTIDNATTKSEFWLAGGYPYLRYSWQNRMDAWLLLGAGAGELMLKEDEAEDATALVVSHLYAAGAKVNVLRYGDLSLAAKADVAANFALSINTENLEDFDTMQQRVRVGLDVAYNYRIATHAIRPHLEVGARLDFGNGGGDIEIGDTDLIPGAEVAGGIRYEYLPLRISIDARGRALVYDTTGLLREWGAGATIRVTPRANGEGISASLTPGWGAPQSRIDNMWQHETPTLTQTTNPTQALSLRGELAYTFKHKDARITPLTQYSLNAQSQTIGLGTRLNLAPLSLELLGERVDYNTTTPDDYRLRLQGSFRF